MQQISRDSANNVIHKNTTANTTITYPYRLVETIRNILHIMTTIILCDYYCVNKIVSSYILYYRTAGQVEDMLFESRPADTVNESWEEDRKLIESQLEELWMGAITEAVYIITNRGEVDGIKIENFAAYKKIETIKKLLETI